MRAILSRFGFVSHPDEAARLKEERETTAEQIYRLAHVIRQQSSEEQDSIRKRRR